MATLWKPRRSEVAPSVLLDRYGALVGGLLWARGIETRELADPLFDPRLDSLSSPFLMQDMRAAAERVADAVMRNEMIAIYADYDIDGMSGLAILVSFIKACGGQRVISHQPDRLAEGYGVHPAAIRGLSEQGAKVAITVDTGISALEAAIEAKRLGLDLIVTDHHQQLGDLPAAFAVVNPNRRDDVSGLGYLSGAGTAFYLAVALRSVLRERGWFDPGSRSQPDLRDWLDLFVLGTVADHVELKADNRALVRAGLKQLRNSKRPGLSALRERVLPKAEEISARDLAFQLTPKLNAASRMGFAALSTELLLTDDPARANVLVEEILALNQRRSDIQAKIFTEAVEQVAAAGDTPVSLAHGDWHEGVLGIVAAKLVEKFNRPAIVLANLEHEPGVLRGSMRTLTGISCIGVLTHCKDLLRKFGGHEMAAGLQVEALRLEDLRQGLREAASQRTDKEISFDAELPIEDLRPERVTRLENLGPWGSGNPEPLYLLSGIPIEARRILKGAHVKFSAKDCGFDAIGFFKADEIERIAAEGHQKIDALLKPELNRFRGTETVQLKLEHVRPHQSLSPST